MVGIKVFWILSSKGGAGKTLFTMCLHRAFYNTKLFDPRSTILIDLNTQNKDLFNILKKVASGEPETLNIDVQGRTIGVFSLRLKGEKMRILSPIMSPDLATRIILPIKVSAILGSDVAIVDTNLNLHTFHTLDKKRLEGIRRELEIIWSDMEEIDPIFFFIWTTGSITRYLSVSKGMDIFEIEAIFESIKKLAWVFGRQSDIFSMRNIIVTINSTLWIYNTITMLRIILGSLQEKLLKSLHMRENIALYSFTRISKDIILRASKLTAEMLAAVSGRKPLFRYLEPMYMLSLYHILFGGSMEILEKIVKEVKIPEGLRLFVEKLRDEKSVDRVPVNLYVVPPSPDVHNVMPFIFSGQLLGENDIRTILGDEDADELPYRLVADQAIYLARYLDYFFVLRERAGTA